MALIKSRKGFFTLFALVCLFALFAGVTFVQSQDTKVETANVKTDAMPASCAELHKQALADGKTMMVDGKECKIMSPEECKEYAAKHGIQCDETDMKACMEKMKAAGLCSDKCAADGHLLKVETTDADVPVMKAISKDMEACLKNMKTGEGCKEMDKAKCAEMEKTAAKGSCCAAGSATMIKADAGETKTDATSMKGKTCDIVTGKCEPAKKEASKTDAGKTDL